MSWCLRYGKIIPYLPPFIELNGYSHSWVLIRDITISHALLSKWMTTFCAICDLYCTIIMRLVFLPHPRSHHLYTVKRKHEVVKFKVNERRNSISSRPHRHSPTQFCLRLGQDKSPRLCVLPMWYYTDLARSPRSVHSINSKPRGRVI